MTKTNGPTGPGAKRPGTLLPLILLSYFTIYIVWGSTYYFSKVAVSTIPAFTVLGWRFFIGGSVFLLFALLTVRLKKRPTLKEIAASVFMGTFLLLGGTGLVTVAVRKVDSYLAALIIASIPIAVAFFDRVLIKKKISLVMAGGILLGLLGVAFLMYNGRSIRTSFNLEMLMLIGASVSWAFATSLGHRIKVHPDSLVNSAIQMLFVGFICLAGMEISGPGRLMQFSGFSVSSILSVLYLALVGSLAFIAYNFLLKHEPSLRIVSYVFVTPLIAILFGFILGHEKSVPYLFNGLALILSGLFLMLYGGHFLRMIGKN
ncbi:MAG: EamA family transporter [bacterium]|nr:EamA family transporter [bacterium]